VPPPEKPPALLEYEGLLAEAWGIYNEATEEISRLRAERDRLKVAQRRASIEAREGVFMMAAQAGSGPLTRSVSTRASIAADKARLEYEEQILALARELEATRSQQAAARGKTFEITRSMKLLEEHIRQGA